MLKAMPRAARAAIAIFSISASMSAPSPARSPCGLLAQLYGWHVGFGLAGCADADRPRHLPHRLSHPRRTDRRRKTRRDAPAGESSTRASWRQVMPASSASCCSPSSSRSPTTRTPMSASIWIDAIRRPQRSGLPHPCRHGSSRSTVLRQHRLRCPCCSCLWRWQQKPRRRTRLRSARSRPARGWPAAANLLLVARQPPRRPRLRHLPRCLRRDPRHRLPLLLADPARAGLATRRLPG